MFPSSLLKTDADLAAIAAAEARRQRAMLDADIATLRGLLAKDAVYIHSSGVVDDEHGYVKPLADGTLTYLTIDMKVSRVRRLSADAILVAGQAAMRVLIKGELKRLDNLFIMNWVRSAAGWQMASWQSTPVGTDEAGGRREHVPSLVEA